MALMVQKKYELMIRPLSLLLGAVLLLGACASPPAPKQEMSFDAAFEAVVGVYANIPDDAHSAEMLGTRRQGSGVLIDDRGLVLTIGYLIMEAKEIAVVGPEGKQIPADAVAYDHATGFGLVRARKALKAQALKLGDSKNLRTGEPVLAVSFDGRAPVVAASVVSRRPFAGDWEYLLEDAIFTMPPHHEYGGAALIDSNGNLVGIGSLIVNDAIVQATPMIGNMFVPVESLRPILTDLITSGRRKQPVPPWLGVYTEEEDGRVYISRLHDNGPAEQAGLKAGDMIIGVGGRRVGSTIDFLRRVHKQGPAGSQVRLDVLPVASTGLTITPVNILSADRYDWLKTKR